MSVRRELDGSHSKRENVFTGFALTLCSTTVRLESKDGRVRQSFVWYR